MGRFATHEDEVDDLFRLGVFVDLYRVVRQGVRAGVESYSIKRLEPLVGYERQVDLHDATAHLIAFEAALDEGRAAEDDADPDRSSPATTRTTAAPPSPTRLARGTSSSNWRPRSEHRCPDRWSMRSHARDRRSGDPRLKGEFSPGIPEDVAERRRRQAKALLADLLEWHRREAKPAWWRFFHVRTLSSADLVGEPDAIGELRAARSSSRSSGRWCGASRFRRRSTASPSATRQSTQKRTRRGRSRTRQRTRHHRSKDW